MHPLRDSEMPPLLVHAFRMVGTLYSIAFQPSMPFRGALPYCLRPRLV